MSAGARAADVIAASGVPAEAVEVPGLGEVWRIEAAASADMLTALRSAGFDLFVDLFGVDTGSGLELTWHLRALARMEDVYVRAPVAYDGEAPSVWHVFPAALYAERETAELLGMSFPGHPNPKRLLTSDEVGVPLLRKDVAVRSAEEVRR